MLLLIKESLMFSKGKRAQLMREREIREVTLPIKILVLVMKAQRIKEELANKMLRDRDQISKTKN
jgi:hypothetical protein